MNTSVPLPLQIVIDDVGWWSGEDGSEKNEPCRSVFCRDHVPADYQAIVSLGKKLNMRPQACMIMCEWDTENILRELPNSQWMGRAWDNSRWVGPWLEEAADIIRSNPDHFELGLHGIGHEYWAEAGRMPGSEWHDEESSNRPRSHVKAHLEYYRRLLDQHDLGPFPESYVPTAHYYYFGLGEEGVVPLFRNAGIKYISVPWCGMRAEYPPQELFGVEEGTVIVNRTRCTSHYHDQRKRARCDASGTSGYCHSRSCTWVGDLFESSASDCYPEGEIAGPICGMHWPNMLSADPGKNEEVVDRWVELLKPYDDRLDRMLSRNTRECWTQLIYHIHTEVTEKHGRLHFDFSGLQDLGPLEIDNTFTVKVRVPETAVLETAGAELIATEWKEDAGYQILRMRAVDG